MYFPYLRGKQFELIALREFACQYGGDNSHITPIVEPVKASLNSLTTAVRTMLDSRFRFAMILNPTEGDFRRVTRNILSDIQVLAHSKEWIPAFLYNENDDDIISAIDGSALTDVMVIYKNGIDDNAMRLLSDPRIMYIVNGDPNSRVVMRRLSRLRDKRIIRLDGCFVERPRNVDYLSIPEEKFTEEHLFYIEDGFYGFSDYTVLPKDYVDGGMLPYAVAIHLTYEKEDDEHEVYVRHFVSDTNDDQSNIAGKFAEAATKVKIFFEHREKTPAVDHLIRLLEEERYPGLGFIKKLSIKNHIELMNRILSR